MRLDENKYTKALQKWKDYSGNLISVLGKLWKDDIELIITTHNALNRQKSVPLYQAWGSFCTLVKGKNL